MVPLHLAAFFVLYVATARLLESEIVSVARETGEAQLSQATLELSQIAVVHTQNQELKHFFGAVVEDYQGIRLKLLLPDGRAIGINPTISVQEVEALKSFVEGDDLQHSWLSKEGDQELMRGFQKLVSLEQCSGCHQEGETLAVASMGFELTSLLTGVRAQSRRNLALLILAWAAALGGSTALVRMSVKRSAHKLEAELEAVEYGESDLTKSGPNLVLDQASARLHRSLRDYLGRQREKQEEVATRLAHTDQLASLGQLAAGLAHEIKNPLAGIQGALEIMREDAAEEETDYKLYGEMLTELNRVNETLQTLLGSARPSPARLALVDIKHLVDEVLRLLEPGLRRKNVKLELELAEGPVEAEIDGAKIRQVLINLIQNAAEAMDDGGRVKVRATSFPGTGGAILAVEDDGPGISEENQRKIFEPFFSTKFSGTGLGLAISRSLIEQHGGSLEVESVAGKGTTFFILLPAGGTALPSNNDTEEAGEA